MSFSNYDLNHVVTPVKADKLLDLLQQTNYNKEKTEYLVNSFKNGFDLGYRGPQEVKLKSPNLKFTIGDEIELWNKVMKEVKEKRYAGPFKEIPFTDFIQSPIGLVPKDGGKKTRLIFHLSYPRNTTTKKSVNANTPENLSTVEYPTFDDAVRLCIKCGANCHAGKSDLSSAFRHLGIRPQDWKFLVMKAKNPIDHQTYYFVDKCLPFGASISCSHFQAFSDALAHIVKVLTKSDNVNYLDDFFFVALIKTICDGHINVFLKTCDEIKFPVSLEKTFWGTTILTFLGLTIDTKAQMVCIPEEKITRAIEMINYALNKKSKKITLQNLQKLCGFLNFLCKCIIPGRAFTRRLYNFGAKLTKPNQHLRVKVEMRMDLEMWKTFLSQPETCNRKFFEFDHKYTSTEIDMYTDASSKFGFGGYNKTEWFIGEWDKKFLNRAKPSINYLELYAVTVAIFNWIHLYKNKNITLFCDNMSVVYMINNTSSNCKNCMVLIRMIVLQGLLNNSKISAKHVVGVTNKYADFLSRLKYKEFRKLSRSEKKKFENRCTPVPAILQNIEDLWLY